MQIMWNRLISVVEEQAQTLVRTAFSTSVREAGDLAAAVFDRGGRMLAQAVTGTPGHINAMAEGMVHFIDRFPVDEMEPGDVLITNDPWKTSGHLHDITVVTPTFRGGKVVALFANTCHVVDIGGRGFGADARQVHEEGLNIPLMHLFRKGEPNRTLLDIVSTNVREPTQVVGDIFSFAAANETGQGRLLDLMDEFGLGDLDALGEWIIESSRAATIEKIRKLKNGTFHNELTMDGYDRPVTLKAALTVSDDHIHVDYAGTSPPSAFGINVVLNYTKAYTCFGVKCVVAPDVPNNYGSLQPITFSAPEDSILNVQRPFAVAARHIIGHLLPDTIMGCLHQMVDGGVQAEGSASLWNVQLRGGALGLRRGRLRREHPRVRDAAVQQRRHGGAADPRRPQRHGVPERRARHAGGGQRGDHAHRLLAQGAPPRFGRPGPLPGRPRPDHRDRRRGRHPLRRAGHVRARRQTRPGAAPAAATAPPGGCRWLRVRACAPKASRRSRLATACASRWPAAAASATRSSARRTWSRTTWPTAWSRSPRRRGTMAWC